MNNDAAIREAKVRALQSLIDDHQVAITELENELESKQLLLAKITMRAQVFGDDDLNEEQKEMLAELPKEIVRLQSKIGVTQQRLERLQAFRVV